MTLSKEELSALIERVRGLKGADREVDQAIYVVATEILGKGHPDAVIHDFGTCVAIRHDGWPWVPTEDEPDPGSWHGVDFAPNFTGSVDVSLALVGRVQPVVQVNMHTFGPVPVAEASLGSRSKAKPVEAATLPAAILLALLLSLQSQEPTL